MTDSEKIRGAYIRLLASREVQRRRFSFAFKYPYGFVPRKPYFFQYNPEFPYANVGEPPQGSRVTSVVLENVKSGLDRAPILEHPEISRATEFLWISSREGRVGELGIPHEQFGLVITPIGEYGIEFSRKLLITTEIMMEMAFQNLDLRESSRQVFRESPQLLLGETARARAQIADGLKDENLAPLSSILEGILSLHQLLTFLLSKKIPGVETGPLALYEAIFRGGDNRLGLIAEATSQFRMGFIGPMTMAGLHFKHGLVRNATTGRVDLSEDARATLKDFVLDEPTRKSRCPMAILWRNFQRGFNGNEAAEEKAGVQLLAGAYWKAFQVVDQLSLPSSTNH